MDGGFFKSWLDAVIFGAIGTFITLIMVGVIARVNIKNIDVPK